MKVNHEQIKNIFISRYCLLYRRMKKINDPTKADVIQERMFEIEDMYSKLGYGDLEVGAVIEEKNKNDKTRTR